MQVYNVKPFVAQMNENLLVPSGLYTSTDMEQRALWMRLRETRWEEYEVSSGSAQRLEKLLQDLASRKRARSMKACHEVWKLLCSGKVYSAALVTIPFLVEILKISNEDTQMEIFDILKSCALSGCDVDLPFRGELIEVFKTLESELAKIGTRTRGDAEIAFAQASDAIDSLLKESE